MKPPNTLRLPYVGMAEKRYAKKRYGFLSQWEMNTFILFFRNVSLMKTVTKGSTASSPPLNTSVSSVKPRTQ